MSRSAGTRIPCRVARLILMTLLVGGAACRRDAAAPASAPAATPAPEATGAPLAARAAPPAPGATGAAGDATQSAADPVGPQTDVRLGVVRFENSGAVAAQPDFLRGVAWLHSFGYEDAIDAFRAAQAKDPRFALAYWGEALAYSQPLWFGEEPAKGRGALARLAATSDARLAAATTAREKGFLRAVEALWGNGDTHARAVASAAAMGELAAAYPSDDEVQVFYALALLATMPRGDASLPMRERAGAIAAAVFARNPKHPGAAHLILHAYDHSALAPRGLVAARAYATIAPASSHALHMPAHVFVQLGLWLDAASSDEASWRASVDWSARRGQPVTTRDFHSLVWWHYELTQLGRLRQARQVASEIDAALASATERDVIGGHHYGDSAIGRGSGPAALRNDKGSMHARFVLESERWNEMAGRSSFDNLDELYVLAVSALKLKDAPRARAAYQELVKAAAPGMDPGLREQAAIMVLEIEAQAAASDGTPAVALVKMDEAVALQAKMPKPIGRPYPVKGADELYGELLLQLGRPDDAVGWFEQTLARTPNRSRALLGLARAAAKAGDAAKSRKAYQQCVVNWANADPDLPELAEARAALGQTRR